MMVDYLATGIEISIAISLVAGIVVGSAMGIAGFGSIWVFRAEMLSLLVGCAVVLIAQSALVIEATASLNLTAGVVAGVCFFFTEPAVGLVALGTAVAVAYLVGKITGKWKSN
jgi:hypothetical protein